MDECKPLAMGDTVIQTGKENNKALETLWEMVEEAVEEVDEYGVKQAEAGAYTRPLPSST